MPAQAYSVQTDKPTLVLEGKNQAQFELGACMALYLWEDLTIAADNNWGGPDSSDKRDWMIGAVVELFESSNYVDSQDVEDRILAIMEDEFDVLIEDSTATDVAEMIIALYQQCAQGNFEHVTALYNRYLAKGSSKKIVNVEGEGEESDDDGDENDEDDIMTEQSEPAIDEKKPQEPLIDDDGFELVQRRKK